MTNENELEENSSPATKKQKRPRPRGTGAIFLIPKSRFWYIGYTGPNGKYIKETSGTEKRNSF